MSATLYYYTAAPRDYLCQIVSNTDFHMSGIESCCVAHSTIQGFGLSYCIETTAINDYIEHMDDIQH